MTSRPVLKPRSRPKPNSPQTAGTGSVSIPPPEPGDVINYVYLFGHEATSGRDEGVKERPVLVIAADARGVAVLPITTKGEAPDRDTERIPGPVAKAMGLPRASESHIVLSEANDFDWRGHDVRDLRNGSFLFGRCPPSYFIKIVRQVQTRSMKITDRR